METNQESQTISETTVPVSSVTVSEKMSVIVVDNRLRVYKGRDQISFHECGSYAEAVEEGNRLQKELNASLICHAPKGDEVKMRHRNFMEGQRKIEKAAKKIAKEGKKSKEEILARQEKDLLALALIEGKTVQEIKAEMGL